MYKRGAIVLQRPPSALHGLLSGLGFGITQGVEKVMAEKERKKNMTTQILENVLQGNIPPGLLATDIGQRFLEQAGISKEPGIKGLLEAGRKEFQVPERTMEMPSGALVNIPGVTPPEVPYEHYAKKEKERKTAAEEETWKKGLERKLRELGITDAFKGDQAREKALRGILAAQSHAKTSGQEIQDLNVNFSTGDVRADFLTSIEKGEKETKRRKDVFGGKTYDQYKTLYNQGVRKAHESRTKAIKFLSSIGTGTDEMSAEFIAAFPNLATILAMDKTQQMPVEDRKKLLIREYNKEVDAWNNELRDMAKKLNLKANEVIKIKHIGPELGELEPPEPKEPLRIAEIREEVVAPKVSSEKEGKSDEEHLEFVEWMKSVGVTKDILNGERARSALEEAKRKGYNIDKIKSLFD